MEQLKEINKFPFCAPLIEKRWVSDIILEKISLKLRLKAKAKSKRRKFIKSKRRKFKTALLGVGIIVVTTLGFGNSAEAVGLPCPTNSNVIIHVVPSHANSSIVKNLPNIPSRKDKLVLENFVNNSKFGYLVIGKKTLLNQEKIKKLLDMRGGDSDLYIKVVAIAVVIYLLTREVDLVEGFINKAAKFNAPNLNPEGPGFLGPHGKHSFPRSRAVVYNSPVKIVETAYGQIPSLFTPKGEEITAWSAAKHIHHAPDFGLDPKNYGMTQSDLKNIAAKGLINHYREGGTMPSQKFIMDLQLRWKKFAEHPSVKNLGPQTVLGKSCIVYKHDKTSLFLSFHSDTQESFTGYRLSPKQVFLHNRTGIIGKNYNK